MDALDELVRSRGAEGIEHPGGTLDAHLAGKTTLARAVAEVLGCPHVELDGLHHGPGWTTRPEFEDDVRRRTVGRRLRRTPLWHGNVEPPFRTFLTDPDHIVRWAWRTHPRTGERVLAAVAGRPELPVVRLRSRREAAAWVAGLSRGTAPASGP